MAVPLGWDYLKNNMTEMTFGVEGDGRGIQW